MTNIRVSRQVIQVLTPAPAVVVPKTLPVILSFIRHPNWVSNMEVSTSWQTDVVRAADSLAGDSTGLMSRPARVIRAQINGLTNDESYAVLLQALRLGQHECPIPLYSDRTRLTADSSVSGSERFLPCNTRFRRFFIGQRVAGVLDELQNFPTLFDTFALGIITAVRSNGLLVSTLSRPFPKGSWVYPLLDCEISLQSNFSLITDEITEFQLEALESIGKSALPAWQGSLNGLFPYAQLGLSQNTFDPAGKLVFDIPHNWRSDLQIKIVREGSRQILGTGSSVTTRGIRPLLNYNLDIETYSREDFWKLLRCFEGLTGRLESFWLPYDQQPWDLVAIDTVNKLFARVSCARTRADIQSFFQFISVSVPSILPGYHEIREINEVAEISPGIYAIAWVEPVLVGFNFPLSAIEVRPVDLVKFDQDVLKESWQNDEVCQTSIQLKSELEEREAPIANLVQPYPVPDPIYNPTIESIPDLQLWLSANKNVYSTDKEGNFVRASTFPNKFCDISAWFDVRVLLPEIFDQLRLTEFTKQFLFSPATNYTTDPDGYINQTRGSDRNNAGYCLVNPYLRYVPHIDFYSQLTQMNNAEKSLWDNAKGWTMIVALTPGEPLTLINQYGGDGLGIVVKDTAGHNLVEWHWLRQGIAIKEQQGMVRMRQTPTTGPIDLLHASPTYLIPTIMVLRFQPAGQGVQVYINGAAGVPGSPWVLVAPVAPTQLAMPDSGQTFGAVAWFTGIRWGIPKKSFGPTGFEAFFGRRQFLNSLISCQRALTNPEMNAACAQIVQEFGGFWNPV